jgi:hypothetical protein
MPRHSFPTRRSSDLKKRKEIILYLSCGVCCDSYETYKFNAKGGIYLRFVVSKFNCTFATLNLSHIYAKCVTKMNDKCICKALKIKYLVRLKNAEVEN